MDNNIEVFDDTDYEKILAIVDGIKELEKEFRKGDISEFDSNFLGLLDNIMERQEEYAKAVRIMCGYVLSPGLTPTQVMLRLGNIKKNIERDAGILKNWTNQFYKNHTKLDKRLLDLICD